MKTPRLSAWVVLALLLVGACRPAAPAASPAPSPTPAEPTQMPAAAVLEATPLPSVTTSPSPSPIPPTPTPAAQICSPLAGHTLAELPGIVSDPYAPPPPGREERHHGVDFAFYRASEPKSILGEGVQSVLAGRVALSLAGSFPYGNVVIVESGPHDLPDFAAERAGLQPGEALYVLYAHLQAAPLVALGGRVSACQELGFAGQSGNAAVPHLHLETRLGPPESRFTGMQFYDTRAKAEDMANYVLWRTSGVFRHFDPLLILAGP